MPQAAPVEPAPPLPAPSVEPASVAPTFAPAPGFEPSREMDVAPGLDRVTLVPQPARLAAGNDVVSGANEKVAVEDSQSSNTEPKPRLDHSRVVTPATAGVSSARRNTHLGPLCSLRQWCGLAAVKDRQRSRVSPVWVARAAHAAPGLLDRRSVRP